MKTLPMVARFQRSRWSDTRKKIEAMRPGDTITIPRTGKEYFVANASIPRFNHAYEGTRQWKMTIQGSTVEIKRIALDNRKGTPDNAKA